MEGGRGARALVALCECALGDSFFFFLVPKVRARRGQGGAGKAPYPPSGQAPPSPARPCPRRVASKEAGRPPGAGRGACFPARGHLSLLPIAPTRFVSSARPGACRPRPAARTPLVKRRRTHRGLACRKKGCPALGPARPRPPLPLPRAAGGKKKRGGRPGPAFFVDAPASGPRAPGHRPPAPATAAMRDVAPPTVLGRGGRGGSAPTRRACTGARPSRRLPFARRSGARPCSPPSLALTPPTSLTHTPQALRPHTPIRSPRRLTGSTAHVLSRR